MTRLSKYLFLTFFLIVNLSCNGGTPAENKTDELPTDNTASDAGSDSANSESESDSDSDSGSDNSNPPVTDTPTPISTKCDLDLNPFTVSLSQLNPTALTNQPTQELRIQANHDVDLIAYLVKESNAIPEVNNTAWKFFNPTTTLDSNVSYTIAAGDGDKTIFLFVKNICNRVSQASNSLAITLDTTPPSGLLTLNDGAKFTLATNPNISGHLVAQDNQSGITKYLITYLSTTPSADDSNWVAVTQNTTLDLTENFALPAPLNQKKYLNAWLQDSAGNISNTISAGIEIMRLIPYEIGQYGAYPSLAINPFNQPYLVAYTELSRGIDTFTIINDEFYHIDFNDFNDPSDLTDATGTFASMKIDSNNFAHIAYHDETHNKLKYARVDLNKPINSFLDQTLEVVTDGGVGASLALDSNNNPHISHQYHTAATGNKDVIAYITKDNTGWVSTNIFNLSVQFPDHGTAALAIDNNDQPLIITDQAGNDNLREYFLQDGTFTSNIFETSEAGYPNIKIAPSGNVYVGYNGFDADYTAKLAIRTNQDWAFTSPQSGNAAYGVSLDIDSDENAYLLHSNPFDQHVALDIYFNNVWQKYVIAPDTLTRVDPSDIIEPNHDIAIDSNDRIHLVYYDVVNHRLTYGTTADAQ